MEQLYSHVLEEGQYFSLVEKTPHASSNGDYVVMESGEPWLVFLGWLQRLLMQLHKHYQQGDDWLELTHELNGQKTAIIIFHHTYNMGNFFSLTSAFFTHLTERKNVY